MEEKEKVKFSFHKNTESPNAETSNAKTEQNNANSNAPGIETKSENSVESVNIDIKENQDNIGESMPNVGLRLGLLVIGVIMIVLLIHFAMNSALSNMDSLNTTTELNTELNQSVNGTLDNSAELNYLIILAEDFERIKITEFVDFMCEDCADFDDDIREFKERYADAIEWEYVQYPDETNQLSVDIAKLYLCTPTEIRQVFRNRMFNNQPDLNETKEIDLQLVKMGLSRELLENCYISNETQTEFENQIKLAKEYEVDKTPWIIINGEQVESNPEVIKNKLMNILEENEIEYKMMIEIEYNKLMQDIEIKLKSEAGQRIDPSLLIDTDPKISIAVITTDECVFCDHQSVLTSIENQYFPNIIFEVIDKNSRTGADMVEKMGLNFFPAFVFSENIQGSANFNAFSKMLDKSDYGFSLNEQYYRFGYRANAPENTYFENVKGNLSSNLTIYNYFNFECDPCKTFYEEVESELGEEYLDKVKWIDRMVPIEGYENTQIVIPSAMCYQELGGEFDTFKRLTFGLQKTLKEASEKSLAYSDNKKFNYLMNALVPEMQYVRGNADITFEDFNSCLNETLFMGYNELTFEETSQQGIQSAPTLIFNEQQMNGAPLSVEDLKTLIDGYLDGSIFSDQIAFE